VVRRRVRRSGPDRFELRISGDERDVLRGLPGQLRTLILGGDALEDPVMRRLYPAAYLDDPESAAEFDGVVRDDLTAGRLSAIETMERTIDQPGLRAEEVEAWLATINDLRLVLGVRLAVTEESEPSDFSGEADDEASFALYRYLSGLEEELVEALSRD
jgi:Domain of unknown function (DUF2017)